MIDPFTEDIMNQLVFVYGTLKRGHGNNRILTQGGSEFVGEAVTKPLYRLWSVAYFPGLTEDFENGKAIQGELWRVKNQETMRRLDALEGVPFLYRREKIQIEGVDEEVLGYIYNQEIDCKECSPVWRG
jgi:gamma-glutamylcyclotransferase (GGCT)/AIG2-like uncharacterized protein YtfP